MLETVPSSQRPPAVHVKLRNLSELAELNSSPPSPPSLLVVGRFALVFLRVSMIKKREKETERENEREKGDESV